MIGRHGLVFIAALLWIVSGSWLGAAWADDIQVNTYTTSDQGGPAVALDADGNFVVVWDSAGSSGTDSSFESIQGQRYAADGAAVGVEFQINTYTTGQQSNPSVAFDADGNFVVVWDSDGSSGTDSSYSSIQGQRYASDGLPVSGEFQVNVYTSNFQGRARVSLDADGDFVFVWESSGSSGTDTSFTSVQGRRYASDGFPLGDQFQINAYTMITQSHPSVSLDTDGDFVVVWDSSGSFGTDSYFSSIQGQRYASDGLPSGGEFQVNTYTTNNQLRPSVSLNADGSFVVVWSSQGSPGTDQSSSSIQGQRFAADGSVVGVQFQVNTNTANSQLRPRASMAADGEFIVVWEYWGLPLPPGPKTIIQGQRYASDGSALSGELQVSTHTTTGQHFSAVGLAADGDFVIVWQSRGSAGTDTDGYSIQRTPAGLIFADGFEFGDLSAWD